MKTQEAQVVPSMIFGGRNSAKRKVSTEPPPALELVASAGLALIVVLISLYIDINIATALPLAVLIGLICRHLFRLTFRSVSSDLFFPTTMVVGYFAIDFAARSFYLSAVPFSARIGRNPYDDYLPAALWFACLGYVAFLSGMESKVARRWLSRMPRPSSWPRSLPALRLLILMMIGLGSLFYLFKIGMTVGNFGNRAFQTNPPPGMIILFANLADLSWIAICIYLIAPAKKSGRGLTWLLLGISIGILCVKLAISGGKVALIQPFIEAAIVVHYGKRRFRLWELMAVGLPILMLAFGVVNFYRFVVVGHQGSPKSLSDVISRISSTSDLLNSTRDSGGQRPALEQMVERNAGTDALALMIKYTPRPFPYVYGLHWLEIPLTFVPRQIWKNKPIDMPSAEFEATYMGMPRNFNGFSSMHLIGDLYRNFSVAGILGGMFLLGILIRFFYLFCAPSPENGTGLFLYAALFPEIIHALESDVGYAFINVTRASLLAVAVAVFLGVRFRRVGRVKTASRPLVFAGRPDQMATSAAESSISVHGILFDRPVK